MSGYSGVLKDGREIYVPHWAVDVGLENLTKAAKYFGAESLISIAQNNVPAAIVALTNVTDAKNTVALIKYFVCSARVDGDKITPNGFNTLFTGKLQEAIEIFTVVVHAQYAEFFELGLVREVSQDD
jgi:hypothetical protein